MDFATMMALEPNGPNTFTGRSPDYPWGGIYGGQTVAQALRAAGMTVPSDYRVHSLHAYYLQQGDCRQPIDFQVTAVRDGRSFVVRSIVARQEHGTILTMTASFHAGELAEDLQTAGLPSVATPEELPPGGWTTTFQRRFAPTRAPGRVESWLSLEEQVGDDPALRACALAYLSDEVPGFTLHTLLYPELPPANDYESLDPSIWTISLDHTVWFHRPAGDGWQFHDFACHGTINSRGLALGHVYDPSGVHLATVSQEVLLRPTRS